MIRQRLVARLGAGAGLSGPAVLLALMTTSPASAADRATEASARQVLERAASDFAAMNYDTGATRLVKMVHTCRVRRCKAATRAALLRDLGAMQFRMGDFGESKKSWADAIKLEPDIELGSSYDSSDLRAAFAEAKGVSPTAAAQPPLGDFAHTPESALKTGAPLPVYVEYHESTALVRVVIKYRSDAMTDWARLNLRKVGDGWGGILPCTASTKGTLRYWVQGFDDGGDPVATSGDPKHPFVVRVGDDVTSPPPRLPGKEPPTCDEAEGAGETAPPPPEETGPAEEPSPKPRVGQPYVRYWIGVSGALDFVSLPSTNDACALSSSSGNPVNSQGYTCTNLGGGDFPLRSDGGHENAAIVSGQAGTVGGGIRAGDVRVAVSFDYALNPSLLVGARLGYVLNSYDGSAAVHGGRAFGSNVEVEARATYLFGDEPLARVGFAPMVFGGLGLAEFDGHASTAVSLDSLAGQVPATAWVTDGPFFVELGGGARYAFSARIGLTLAARLNAVFGGSGFLATYGPEVGVAYGF
jgi:hypothetical protein